MKTLKFAILACILFASTCYAQTPMVNDLMSGQDFLTFNQSTPIFASDNADSNRQTYAIKTPPVVTMNVRCLDEPDVHVHSIDGLRVVTVQCRGWDLITTP
jgi:hypothetical protein